MSQKRSLTGQLVIGMMSGTSVDGIDTSLVEFTTAHNLKVIDTVFTPFSKDQQSRINTLAHSNAKLDPHDNRELDLELADLYSQASLDILAKNEVSTNDISAIANHGQTVRHLPDAKPPISLQLGNGQRIANETGIPTITQFRQADLDCGGQGAPLMPAFHQAMFDNPNNFNEHIERDGKAVTRFVLNIGGIANISRLASQVIGFDTGPGNTLLDQWIQQSQNRRFDQDGQWASSGTVIQNLLDELLEDDYFKLPFPKSTGTDYFNLDWLQQKAGNLHVYQAQDVQATLLTLSIQSIAHAFEQLGNDVGEIFVCGGGVHNAAMMKGLNRRLSNFVIKDTASLGIPADWVESVGFAWLGYCHLHGIPSNLPSVTGASKKVVLGQQFLPKQKTMSHNHKLYSH